MPDLAVTGVRYLSEGWDSAVFLVNERLIVRFPKRPDVLAQLKREYRLLPELAPSLPVPVPAFSHFVQGCAAAPLGFAGYPLLPGEQLCALTLSAEQTARLAEQTGRFLAALHAFPVERARALGIEAQHPSGGPRPWHRFVEETLTALSHLLSASERRWLVRWFSVVEDEGLFEFAPALTHCDLGDEHLLVDRRTGDLTAVIDFGDAGIGDPAIDFTGLLRELGEAATRVALRAYGRADAAALLRRAARYGELSPLHELRFGVFVNDEGHIAAGLSRLRAELLA
jgi:aminoglycoside phosphotransferase (APT) family kinase protein